MAAFFAFLHHVAAFVVFAALIVEFVAIKDELTATTARRLQLADLALGISAGIVLVAGLLRVFLFEKGASFYFQNVPFIAKFSLFVLVALLSLYPTLEFLSWGRVLRQGQVPQPDARKLQRIRTVIHVELLGVVLLILLAVLMARGVGMLA
jgi:putative membrane protein